MKESLLKLVNINKSYNNIPILKDITLSLNEGEILSLVGENGAGKSTLTKIISGAVLPDSGEIYYQGQKIDISNPKEAKQLGINVIYQDLNLFEGLSVAENIFCSNFPTLFNLSSRSFGYICWKSVYKKSHDLCKKYGYNIDVRKKVQNLSMGERQIVAIMKALSQNTSILIMDEPTAALPKNDVEKIINIVKHIKKLGVSVIYITHNIDEIPRLSDRIVLIKDGEIAKNEIVSKMHTKELIHVIAGKDIRNRYPKLNTNKSGELLRIESFNKGDILKNISLKLYKGEILGLTGLLGAGKSSIARAIFGADKIDTGEIFIKGIPVDIKNPKTAVKYGVSFIPEDIMGQELLSEGSIAQNITIAHVERTKHQIIKPFINKKYENLITNQYIKKLAIKCTTQNQTVSQLSGGNQQKVLISRWLFTNTEILLLDEPTKGLDIASKVEMYNIMNELSAEGKGILFISSDLSEISGMCDRILILYNGSIIKELMRSEATKENILYYMSGGK